MAKIVITSTTNSIRAIFNDYAIQLDMEKGSWNKSHVNNIVLKSSLVLVNIKNESDWLVSFDGAAGTYKIDTINGGAPTSNSDLYDKLNALIT